MEDKTQGHCLLPRVSVIIPVYNVESYINECLSSILYQTYKEIEVIMVDDGSTDNSTQICREFACKDKRFKLFLKENQGPSAARNYGLSKATGEYFTFVDSDDYLDANLIESLVRSITETESQVALCGTAFVKGKEIVKKTPPVSGVVSSEKVVCCFFLEREGVLHTPWGKLFDISVRKDVHFPEERIYYEDQFVMYHIILNCKCSLINDAVYYYRIRKGSLITDNRYIEKKTLDMMASMEVLKEEVEETCPNLIGILNVKLVNDCITLVKYCIANDFYNDTYCFAREKISNNNIYALRKEGISVSHMFQYLLIKYCAELFIILYKTRRILTLRKIKKGVLSDDNK